MDHNTPENHAASGGKLLTASELEAWLEIDRKTSLDLDLNSCRERSQGLLGLELLRLLLLPSAIVEDLVEVSLTREKRHAHRRNPEVSARP